MMEQYELFANSIIPPLSSGAAADRVFDRLLHAGMMQRWNRDAARVCRKVLGGAPAAAYIDMVVQRVVSKVEADKWHFCRSAAGRFALRDECNAPGALVGYSYAIARNVTDGIWDVITRHKCLSGALRCYRERNGDKTYWTSFDRIVCVDPEEGCIVDVHPSPGFVGDDD